MFIRILAILALVLFPSVSFSQTSVTESGIVVPATIGQYTNIGCPTGIGVETYCFIPYTSTNPFTIGGTVTATQPIGTNFHIVCDGGCSSSTAPADKTPFTPGTTSQTPVGGFFQTTSTANALSDGDMGAFQVTSTRALFSNLRDANGVELGIAASPLQVSLANTAANGTPVLVNGSITATQATGSNLHVVCDSGCSTSTAPSDEAAFTAGSTSQSPVGGFFQTTATNNPLTTGQMGAFQVTANRALFSNLRNAAGTEVGTSGAPLRIDTTGSTTQPISAVSLPLPTGASTATNQTGGGQKTQIVDGSGNVIASTSNNLNVQCANCSGTGASAVDEVSYTAGASVFAPGGGFFQTTATTGALTNGQQGLVQMTATRAFFTNLRNAAGAEAGTSGVPLRIDPTGSTTQPISAASLPLPTGAASATNQTGGGQKTQIVDGSGNVIASTSNNLNVQCANCSGSGASAVDEASFTAGSSVFAPGGGFFQTTATSNPLTDGQQGLFQMTATRAMFTNLRNASGTELGVAAAPLQVSVANTGANATAIKVDGSAVTQPVSGTVTAVQATGSNLHVVCDTGCSGTADETAFTAGSTLQGPVGGFFQTTATTNALTNGQMGAFQVTANRALFTNLRTAAGVEIGVAAAPVQVSLANTATNATAVKVDGSAATQPVSGTVTVTQGTGTNLHTVCDSGCTSTAADEATFTAGSTQQALVGGFFQTTATSNALTTGQMGAFQVTANRALFTNLRTAAGVELGTSGAPLRIDPTGSTVQPISATALPLPTGAATSANQTTAAAIGSTTSGQTGTLVQGAVTTAAPTYTTAQTDPLSLTTAGALRVDASGTTQPVSGTVTANAGTNLNTSLLALETGGNLATIAGAVTSSIMQSNTKQVNGVTTLAGAGAVGTGAQRVAVGQDTTTIAGSAPGTAGSPSTNVISVQGVSSGTVLPANLTQVGGTAVVTGGVNGSQGVGGLAANGVSVAGSPVLHGGRAQNAEITAVTNGQAVDAAFDLTGKMITMPYANKENFVSASVNTASATNTSLVAAAGASIKIYMTGFSCANTGATASLLSFTSGSGGTTLWTTINPAGGGSNGTISPPIATAANTALFLTTASASTTQYCSVTGYTGT